MTIQRTPTEYRAILDDWRSRNNHLSDSEIMPKQRHVRSPRHARIAAAIRSLLAWRDIVEPQDTFQTNFLRPDNDNGPKEPDEPRPSKRDVECEIEIRPTVNELMNAVSTVRFVNGFPAKGDPNVEFGPMRDGIAPFSRIGGLQLSVVDYKRTHRDVPPRRGEIQKYESGGRWYNPRDRFGTPKGEAPDYEEINNFYCSLLGATPNRNVKALPKHLQKQPVAPENITFPDLPPTALSLARARAWCGLPPSAARDSRAALPWRPASAKALFMSGSVTGNGGVAPPPRNDPDTQFENRQTASTVKSAMLPLDASVLDHALTAGTFEDVGCSLGFNGKIAERRGQRAVIAASQNFSKKIGGTGGLTRPFVQVGDVCN